MIYIDDFGYHNMVYLMGRFRCYYFWYIWLNHNRIFGHECIVNKFLNIYYNMGDRLDKMLLDL